MPPQLVVTNIFKKMDLATGYSPLLPVQPVSFFVTKLCIDGYIRRKDMNQILPNKEMAFPRFQFIFIAIELSVFMLTFSFDFMVPNICRGC